MTFHQSGDCPSRDGDIEREEIPVMPGDSAGIPRNDIGEDNQLQPKAGTRSDGFALETCEVVDN